MSTAVKKRRRSVDNIDDLVVGKFYAPEELDVRVEDYEEALLIDEHALEEALQQQPDLFYRVSKVLSLQISRRDAAKQFLANQEALLDAQLRRSALHKDGGRTTEKEIESQKRVAVSVVNATDQLLRMDHSVRQWTVMKDAVVQRGHALRELVELYVANYYQTGSVTVGKLKDQALDTVKDHYKKKRQHGNERL